MKTLLSIAILIYSLGVYAQGSPPPPTHVAPQGGFNSITPAGNVVPEQIRIYGAGGAGTFKTVIYGPGSPPTTNPIDSGGFQQDSAYSYLYGNEPLKILNPLVNIDYLAGGGVRMLQVDNSGNVSGAADSSSLGLRQTYVLNNSALGGLINSVSFRSGTLANLTGFGPGFRNCLPYYNKDSLASGSVVVGGLNNTIPGNGSSDYSFSFIGGGVENQINNSGVSGILAGQQNNISKDCFSCGIAAGYRNFVGGSLNMATGTLIYIDSSVNVATIAGDHDTIIGASHLVVLGGENNHVTGNTFTQPNKITSVVLGNNNRIQDNLWTGAAGSIQSPGIGYVNLWDNCQINGTRSTGNNNTIWDIHAKENCFLDTTIFDGDNNQIDLIQQSNFDSVNYSNFTGNNSFIRDISQFANSAVNNTTLVDDNYIRRVMQIGSSINNTTFSSGDGIKDVFQIASTISNCSVSIDGLYMFGVNWDMTGASTPAPNTALFGGPVGIGTVTPSSKLHVAGAITLTDSSGTSPIPVRVYLDANGVYVIDVNNGGGTAANFRILGLKAAIDDTAAGVAGVCTECLYEETVTSYVKVRH